MKQGIIMKVYKNYSVVLSEQKYYRVINKTKMEQGQIILFSNEDLFNSIEQRSGIMRKFKVVAAVAAALLVMVSAGIFMNQKAVASYVVVDINPSVQLEVNDEEIVIGYSALNDDAETLQLDYIVGLSVEKAVEYIAIQAEEAGFLNTEDLEDDFILVTTVSDEDGEDVKALLESLKETSEILKRVNVAIIDASEEEMDAALADNLPVGLVAIAGGTELEDLTVKSYFGDDANREAFEEEGYILPEDFGHEVERVNLGLMNVAISDEVKEEIIAEFLAAKEAFFVAKEEFEAARDAYREALASGDEEAIAAAKIALDEAEANKDALEEIKDEVEEVKDLLLAELDDEDQEREFQELAFMFAERRQEKIEAEEERQEEKTEREQERIEAEEDRQEEKTEREQERIEADEEREVEKTEREQERIEAEEEREVEKEVREEDRSDDKMEREEDRREDEGYSDDSQDDSTDGVEDDSEEDMEDDSEEDDS